VHSTAFLSNYHGQGDATNKTHLLSLYSYHRIHVTVYRNKSLKEFLGSVFVPHTANKFTPWRRVIREKCEVSQLR